jgi:DNA (cytosine-5)-methyltransferase 1
MYIKSMINYIDYINETIKPRITEQEVVLDLFAGCGGLSLGFEAAGYKTIGYEMDIAASDTYNKNLVGGCFLIKLDLDFDYHNQTL